MINLKKNLVNSDELLMLLKDILLGPHVWKIIENDQYFTVNCLHITYDIDISCIVFSHM